MALPYIYSKIFNLHQIMHSFWKFIENIELTNNCPDHCPSYNNDHDAMFVTRRALIASELREDEVTLELVLLAKFSHFFFRSRIYSLISSPAFSGVCALKHPTERFICSSKHSVLTPFPSMNLSLFSVSYGLTLVQQILSLNGQNIFKLDCAQHAKEKLPTDLMTLKFVKWIIV